jgi:hypothetical protein
MMESSVPSLNTYASGSSDPGMVEVKSDAAAEK